MNDSLLMISSFIKKPKEIGAVTPSSKFLTKEIIKYISFKDTKIIIELGPGLGTFTRAILKKANPNTRIFCFEINKNFCRYLNKNISDKRMVLIESGAENITENLKKFGIERVDCIISGLPFRNFPDARKKRILAEVKKCLKEDGKFVLFQYTNGINGILKSYFGKVSRKFVPINVPPSFVYVCEK